MANTLQQHKYNIAIAATGVVVGFVAAKLLNSKNPPLPPSVPELNDKPHPVPKLKVEPKNEEESVYETQKYVNEYLLLHYGEADEVLRHSFVPMDSLEFPRRVGKECLDAYKSVDKSKLPNRAFDVGCGLGRTTFELAREFEECIGLEKSQSFVDACNELKQNGEMTYHVCEEGDVHSTYKAKIDPEIDRSRTKFIQGDACNLSSDLGQFSCVVAANLICRLPNPYKFLERLPHLVAPGGLLVLTTPCTWLTQFTPKKYWLGGHYDQNGKPVTTFETLKRILGPNFILIEEKNMRFFIRETARKNQWVVTQATIWRRR